jgi:beta-lactamase class A
MKVHVGNVSRGFLAAILMLFVPAARAPAEDVDMLQSVAQRVADQIVQNPANVSGLYAPSFLQVVPVDKIISLYQTLFSQNGPVLHVMLDSRTGPSSGKFIFACNDVQMPVTLDIEPDAPHRVIGLWIGPAGPRVNSLDQIAQKLAELPGEVSFQVQCLDDGKVLAAHDPDRALAIGSGFKLYILATLSHQRIAWDKVVTLEDRFKSLPSGELQNWPAGSPVTVHTLAVKMISQSDNTAADHLLALAGRENVEAMLPELGMKNPAADIPFLGTREVFRLKANEALRGQYLAADVAGRRALLAKMLGTPGPSVNDFASGGPTAIDKIEWFASAADLCRLMKWFDSQADPATPAILAVNPGLIRNPSNSRAGLYRHRLT